MNQTSTDILDALRLKLIRDPEARWRTLTENSLNHIMFLDPAGTILFINRSLPNLDPDTVIGDIIYDRLRESDAALYYRHFEKVIASKKASQFDFSLYDDEHVHYYECRIYPIIEQHEVIALITDTRDITTQHLQQHKLDRNHTLLNTVISNSPIIIWALDNKGVFTLSEGKGLAALGLEPGQVVGQSIFDIYADSRQDPRTAYSFR